MAEMVINVIFDASKICTTSQKSVQCTLFESIENTVRLDKTRQLHQRIRSNICNVANRERKQTKRALFICSTVMYFYHLLFVILDASRIKEHIFEPSKMYENIERVKSAFKAPCTFWTRRRNMLIYFNVFLTRRAHFRGVQNDIEL